jgi:hypothetical protein
MPNSKEFNLTDYLLLGTPLYGDQIWAAKRKLTGQNDFLQALDYAIQGDSSGFSRLSPLAVTLGLSTLGYKLPGMKPSSRLKKITSSIIGRAGNAILGRHLKPALLSIPASLLTQSLVSGQRTKDFMQDKVASLLSNNNDDEISRRMSNANVAASLGAGLAPQIGGHVYLNNIVPSLYKGAQNPLSKKQQQVFDRFIRSKNFHVDDFQARARDISHMYRSFDLPLGDMRGSFGPMSTVLKTLFSGPFYAPNDGGLMSKILKRVTHNSSDKNFKKTKGFINLNNDFFDGKGHSGQTLKPGVLAHEVGHGVGPSAYLKGGMRQLSMLLPGLNLGQVLLAKDEDHGRMGAMLSPLTAAPLLGSEIDASVRGSKILSKLTKGKLPLLQRLSPFVGLPTYAAFAASPALAHLIKKNMGGYVDKK